MKGITRMRRRIGVAAIGLSLTAGLVVPAAPAGAFIKPPQAYGGFGSGVETFADVAPALGLLKAQVALGRSAVNSQGLTTINDELNNSVSVANGDKASRALGAPLELTALNAPVQLVAPAVADAPPSSTATGELLNLPVPPLADVKVLPGEAAARFNEDGNVCIIGADLARGRGAAATAGLLNNVIQAAAPDGTPPASSTSRQLLTAQVREDGSVAGTKLGVQSEVVQHIVPVTISDPATGVILLNVDVVGDVRLRAFAGGLPGTSFIEYSPPPVIRITVPPASPLSGLLGGLLSVLPAPIFTPATGVLEVSLGAAQAVLDPVLAILAPLGIVIGEQPRAIGGAPGSAPLERADGTASAAAIDLVRIQPAGALAALADIVPNVRVGHMEVLAFAPPGGIDCPGLGVAKVVDRDPVQVGETFTYTISVVNPYDCILRNVRVQDDITGTAGVTFTVGTTQPPASSVTPLAGGGTRVIWNDIGPIPARGTGTVQVQVTVNSATSNGRISDTATVTADCATGGGTGTTNVNLNLRGSVTLNAPQVGGAAVVGELPRTGRNDGLYLGFALVFLVSLAGVETLRRRSRNHD